MCKWLLIFWDNLHFKNLSNLLYFVYVMLDGALFLPYISKFGRVSYCMYLFCVVSYSFENYLASTYVHDLLSFVCSMELLSY